MPRKYEPLGDYLASQAATTMTVTLTLAEIEAIIGAALPRSARTSAFWANTHWYGAPGHIWRRVQWRKERTQLHAIPPTVTFARLPPDSTA